MSAILEWSRGKYYRLQFHGNIEKVYASVVEEKCNFAVAVKFKINRVFCHIVFLSFS